MATKEEETQKDTWWLNELESLGVQTKGYGKEDHKYLKKR